MEDRKRTALAAVIITVVLAAVLYSFSLNLFAQMPELVLPDPDADRSMEPGAESSGGQGGLMVGVSTRTVQTLIASLTRYESYSRSITVEYYDAGQLVGTVSAQVWADDGWTRSDLTLSSGRVEHTIVGGGQLWLWYDREEEVYSGPTEGLSADLFQRLPTYEAVLELDTDSITAADYVDRDGLPCVFVEAVMPDLNYVERYWISETSGLLMAAETEKDGALIYALSSHEVVSPLAHAAGIFTLPDGTQLYSPEG